MFEPESDHTQAFHQLIFVSDDVSHFEYQYKDSYSSLLLNDIHCQQLSIAEFKQISLKKVTSLLVIITDDTCLLTKIEVDFSNVFVIAENENCEANVYLTQNISRKKLTKAIKMGFEFLAHKQQISRLTNELSVATKARKEFSQIGIALSSEKDLDKLLNMVLKEGRKVGCCEAASLYLISHTDSNQPELLFKLTQNSTMDLDLKEKKFPLTKNSLAGYVALSGKILNIADTHQLPSNVAYSFDSRFDDLSGYRTKQMLVLPMRNHKGKVIGVLQFINNKNNQVLADPALGFDPERADLLLSLASQAAVAIDNSQLIENIQSLFEGFVSASVKAIESRDPVTSGHSFRVAEYTSSLAICLDKSCQGLYKDTHFSKEKMREIRYASLLHDFGKVGVKENVLLKANKLHDSRYHFINMKIEWQKQTIQKKFYQSLLSQNENKIVSDWKNTAEYVRLKQQLAQLSNYQKILLQANKPSVLDVAVADELKQLFDFNLDGSFPYDNKNILNEKDFLSLSVTRGSLTQEERDEIQSHVVHTQEFLLAIPWTDELNQVPMIAGAHHEKLDGSGYPNGLYAQEIPVASKIMAVADIYDALTARDRPYKNAVSTELALDILKEEALSDKLCSTMVSAFIDAKVYQCIDLKQS